MENVIADIRRDYKLKSLEEKDTPANPFDLFDDWWKAAVNSDIDEVNAMTLATVNNDGADARIVLLKGYTTEGFVFFTNYNSSKGKQLASNGHAALLFFWKELERQVRIQGAVSKISDEASDAYFYSRPAGSRIGAWASNQSTRIESRQVLEDNEIKYQQQFGDQIPRPPHWGGYIVQPARIEFWQGRPNRLHDRIVYKLDNTQDQQWSKCRLAP